MKQELARTEVTLLKEQHELEKWLDYKEIGTLQDSSQIQLLKQELVDMERSFKEMTGQFEKFCPCYRAPIVVFCTGQALGKCFVSNSMFF